MENSLDHLPANKQGDLGRVVKKIREMWSGKGIIILYGSYARGDWKEASDIPPNAKSGHPSDYDILVVTDDQDKVANSWGVWPVITKACNSLGLSAQVHIITNDIIFVNEKIEQGRYFFHDIKKEGRILFDSGDFKLATNKIPTLKEKQQLAQEYFEEGYEGNAASFYRRFKNAIEDKDYKNAAFQLNQVVEAAYKTVLLVFSNYCPYEHLLNTLGEEAAFYHSDFKNIFPQGTEEEKHLFGLLNYAYIGARYDRKFKISKEELEALIPHVQRLLDLVEKHCKEKIASIINEH